MLMTKSLLSQDSNVSQGPQPQPYGWQIPGTTQWLNKLTSEQNKPVELTNNTLAYNSSSNNQTGVSRPSEVDTAPYIAQYLDWGIRPEHLKPEPYSKDGVAISSFGPQNWRKPGGNAINDPSLHFLGNRVSGTYAHHRLPTDSGWREIISTLEGAKAKNGGTPLSRIFITSHGGFTQDGRPGLELADGSIYSVESLVRDITNSRLIHKGGTLRLGGCSLALTPESRDHLRAVAQKYGIYIIANEGFSQLIIPVTNYIFSPTGSITKKEWARPD